VFERLPQPPGLLGTRIESQRFLNMKPGVCQTAGAGFGDCETNVCGRVQRIEADRFSQLFGSFGPSTFEVEGRAELSVGGSEVLAH
jgi:hypothetical protein